VNIIAFDTATDVFSAGLAADKKRYFLSVDGGQKHSELIMDAADTLLGIAGIERKNLQAVACMEGPGSFTGLRIGFAAAKGLAFALGIPVIPLPTLDCMAMPYSFWPGIVLPVIDAKKNAFFTALYRQGKRLSGYLDIEIKDLVNAIAEAAEGNNPSLLVTGPAAAMVFNRLSESFPNTVSCSPCETGFSAELLNLAIEKVIIGVDTSGYSAGPLYLRKSDAELSKNTDKTDG
jgi:tRNA threonylcarbamoyladenosine biosynthesis protein TsaB